MTLSLEAIVHVELHCSHCTSITHFASHAMDSTEQQSDTVVCRTQTMAKRKGSHLLHDSRALVLLQFLFLLPLLHLSFTCNFAVIQQAANRWLG